MAEGLPGHWGELHRAFDRIVRDRARDRPVAYPWFPVGRCHGAAAGDLKTLGIDRMALRMVCLVAGFTPSV